MRDIKTKTAIIYSIDDQMGVPVYVGFTTNHLNDRKKCHQTSVANKVSKLYTFLREANIPVILTPIEEIVICNMAQARFWEMFWIRQFKAWGFALLNEKEECPILTDWPEFQDRIDRLNEIEMAVTTKQYAKFNYRVYLK